MACECQPIGAACRNARDDALPLDLELLDRGGLRRAVGAAIDVETIRRDVGPVSDDQNGKQQLGGEQSATHRLTDNSAKLVPRCVASRLSWG